MENYMMDIAGHDESDPFMNKKTWVRSISMVSCGLSVVGTLLIITSFLCFKELRSLGRQILVNISAMDLGVALANFAGAAAYFDGYYHKQTNCTTRLAPILPLVTRHTPTNVPANVSVMCPESGTIDGLCISQAFFSVYFTYASILWTNSLSCYLYFRIVHNGTNLALYSLRFSYVFCYLMPLFLSVWLILAGKIGFSPYESSGWCSIILKDPADPTRRDIFVSIFGYNLWIVLTFVLVPLLSISVYFYVRNELKKPFLYKSSDRLTLALHNIDYKFLLIPMVFIILRVWSFLGDVLNVFAVGLHIPRWLAFSLVVLEGIGDSAQGFTNGILFVLFTRRVRDKFLSTIMCCRKSAGSLRTQHVNVGEKRYLLGQQTRTFGSQNQISTAPSSEHTPPVTD